MIALYRVLHLGRPSRHLREGLERCTTLRQAVRSHAFSHTTPSLVARRAHGRREVPRAPKWSQIGSHLSRAAASLFRTAWDPWFWAQTLWIALHFGAVIHLFMKYILQRRSTIGPSMLPTLNTQYDSILLSPLFARGKGIQVGDVVSFDHPVRGEYSGVKRVIGMPGDFVLRDTPPDADYFRGPPPLEADDDAERHALRLEVVQREHRMIRVPEGHCWIVGDNFDMSRDSRMYGPLPLALIRGKVIAAWGEQGFRILRNPLHGN